MRLETFYSSFRKEGETVLSEETQSENKTEENKSSDDLGFRPFVTDPAKQARYEKYLGFIKIGANGKAFLIY